jgi:hypothetical protein
MERTLRNLQQRCESEVAHLVHAAQRSEDFFLTEIKVNADAMYTYEDLFLYSIVKHGSKRAWLESIAPKVIRRKTALARMNKMLIIESSDNFTS